MRANLQELDVSTLQPTVRISSSPSLTANSRSAMDKWLFKAKVALFVAERDSLWLLVGHMVVRHDVIRNIKWLVSRYRFWFFLGGGHQPVIYKAKLATSAWQMKRPVVMADFSNVVNGPARVDGNSTFGAAQAWWPSPYPSYGTIMQCGRPRPLPNPWVEESGEPIIVR